MHPLQGAAGALGLPLALGLSPALGLPPVLGSSVGASLAVGFADGATGLAEPPAAASVPPVNRVTTNTPAPMSISAPTIATTIGPALRDGGGGGG